MKILQVSAINGTGSVITTNLCTVLLASYRACSPFSAEAAIPKDLKCFEWLNHGLPLWEWVVKRRWKGGSVKAYFPRDTKRGKLQQM